MKTPSGHAAIKAQSYIRRWLAKRKVRNVRYRQQVAKEILSTEQHYISCLRTVLKVYYKPLRESSLTPDPLISKEDVSVIFSNIETIVGVNEVLCSEIAERVAKWHSLQVIGDIFLRLGSLLNLYKPYCENYSGALRTIQRCREKQALATMLKELEEGPDSLRLSLTALLIQPIQRIPRYILLLSDLLKHTWASHPDFTAIHSALARIRDIGTNLNESVRVAENEFKLYTMQSLFVSAKKSSIPVLVVENRWFKHSGNVQKVARRFVQSRFLLLFNDCLMMASRILNTSYLQYKKTVNIGSAWVRSLPDTDDVQNAFQLVLPQVTYTLFTKTADEKTQWLQMLNEVIDALVLANPALKDQRGQVRVAAPDRFFSLFTLSPQQYDPQPMPDTSPTTTTTTTATAAAVTAVSANSPTSTRKPPPPVPKPRNLRMTIAVSSVPTSAPAAQSQPFSSALPATLEHVQLLRPLPPRMIARDVETHSNPIFRAQRAQRIAAHASAPPSVPLQIKVPPAPPPKRNTHPQPQPQPQPRAAPAPPAKSMLSLPSTPPPPPPPPPTSTTTSTTTSATTATAATAKTTTSATTVSDVSPARTKPVPVLPQKPISVSPLTENDSGREVPRPPPKRLDTTVHSPTVQPQQQTENSDNLSFAERRRRFAGGQ
eukprot:TRINITY_DN3655_c0_g1_i1.p1 TRINITY_DN3655_c0_g1~~TRINITY_DN3655_c0_g1_i1.p1  ORF type:complete len:658 (-),score=118.49 TRINITY_DN3655_c0_g1_i1:4456-6429(-)